MPRLVKIVEPLPNPRQRIRLCLVCRDLLRRLDRQLRIPREETFRQNVMPQPRRIVVPEPIPPVIPVPPILRLPFDRLERSMIRAEPYVVPADIDPLHLSAAVAD